MFLQDVPEMLEDVARAIDLGETAQVEDAAHALKSAVGIVSAQVAFDAALRVEKIGCSGDLSDASGAYDALKAEIDRLIEVLSTETAEIELCES